MSSDVASKLSQGQPHRWPVLVWLPAVLAFGVLMALFAWGCQAAIRKDRRRETRMNLQMLLAGLSQYRHNFDQLPFPVRRFQMNSAQTSRRNGQGEALYSWRVEMIPYLESWHGSWDRSRRWDSPANRDLLELSGFFCYDQSFFKITASESKGPFPETNALAITGPGTAFGDGMEQPMSLKDVPADAILLVKARTSGIPSANPGDIDIRTVPQTINGSDGKGIPSRDPAGFHVGFADGMSGFYRTMFPLTR